SAGSTPLGARPSHTTGVCRERPHRSSFFRGGQSRGTAGRLSFDAEELAKRPKYFEREATLGRFTTDGGLTIVSCRPQTATRRRSRRGRRTPRKGGSRRRRGELRHSTRR